MLFPVNEILAGRNQYENLTFEEQVETVNSFLTEIQKNKDLMQGLSVSEMTDITRVLYSEIDYILPLEENELFALIMKLSESKRKLLLRLFPEWERDDITKRFEKFKSEYESEKIGTQHLTSNEVTSEMVADTLLSEEIIQELQALFPHNQQVLNSFTHSQVANVALGKVEQKIEQLKLNIKKIKLLQAEKRREFLDNVQRIIDNKDKLYSEIDTLIAEYSLDTDVNNLVDLNDTLLQPELDTKRVLLAAWNKLLDNRDIYQLEDSIGKLQQLKIDLIN